MASLVDRRERSQSVQINPAEENRIIRRHRGHDTELLEFGENGHIDKVPRADSRIVPARRQMGDGDFGDSRSTERTDHNAGLATSFSRDLACFIDGRNAFIVGCIAHLLRQVDLAAAREATGHDQALFRSHTHKNSFLGINSDLFEFRAAGVVFQAAGNPFEDGLVLQRPGFEALAPAVSFLKRRLSQEQRFFRLVAIDSATPMGFDHCFKIQVWTGAKQ